jgi:hypothetical protein
LATFTDVSRKLGYSKPHRLAIDIVIFCFFIYFVYFNQYSFREGFYSGMKYMDTRCICTAPGLVVGMDVNGIDMSPEVEKFVKSINITKEKELSDGNG